MVRAGTGCDLPAGRNRHCAMSGKRKQARTMTHDNNPDEEVPPMTNKNIRASLLATVIVGMLSGSAIAADRGHRQGEPPRINAATMGDQQSFSRFIVTYRDGTAAKNNRSAIARTMANALAQIGREHV